MNLLEASVSGILTGMIEFAVITSGLLAIALVPFWQRLFVPASSLDTKRGTVPTGRSLFFDFARGVAILSVIGIHITYILTPIASDLALVNDMVNNLLRFALPIFFISSGVLLAAPQWNWRWMQSFYLRRLLALGVPYALVTGLLTVWHDGSVGLFLYNLLTGDAAIPLYFVPVLFQLYLLYPFIYKYSQYRWFVWLSLVVSVVCYSIPELRGWQDLSFATPFLFFFVWGIYMRSEFQQVVTPSAVVGWASIAGLFFALQWYFGVERFYNGQYFYGVAVLMLLYVWYSAERTRGKVMHLSAYIGRKSLWIFLTHFTVLEVLWKALESVDTIRGAVQVGVFVFGGLMVSVLVGLCLDWLYRQGTQILTGRVA